MKNTNNKIEEFIRVDHAGERGAVKIYEGQLLALNTFIKDENLKKIIEEMKIHEKEHCDFFETEIKKRNIAPTKFLPLWDLMGVGLGFGSTLLGKKAAMLCTASASSNLPSSFKVLPRLLWAVTSWGLISTAFCPVITASCFLSVCFSTAPSIFQLKLSCGYCKARERADLSASSNLPF